MQIFIGKGDERTGPFSEEEVRSMLKARTVELADLAWYQGMKGWEPLYRVLPPEATIPPATTAPNASPAGEINPYAAPLSTDLAPGQAASANDGAMFLHIGPARLALMSLLTLGLYERYWIYRNWRYVKERNAAYSQIKPFWRGIFGIFYVHALFRLIHKNREMNQILPARFQASMLGTGWVILTIIGYVAGRSDDPTISGLGILVSAPSFLFLLPVQRYINAVHGALPVPPPYYRFSAGHVVCLVVGLVILLLIAASFLPVPEGSYE